MGSVLLATFDLLPEGEYGGDHLLTALAERGHEARWVVWDDPAVDWSAADLVAVRSTWDYQRRCAEFLDWVRAVEQHTPVLNGSAAFAWNADKSYLTELAADVPVVPTELLDGRTLVPGLTAAFERWGSVVVKPRTGAGGVGVVLADRIDDPRLEGLTAAPWVVQPLVESVRTTGETSVFVLGGQPASQVDKRAAAEEIRVHEMYGGTSTPVDLGEETSALATRALAAAEERLSVSLPYGRVDMMRWQGEWVVSELELIEPGLYLDVLPANAEPFADVVGATLQPPGPLAR